MNSRAVVVLSGLCAFLLAGLLLRLALGPAAAQTPAVSETGRYSLVSIANAEYFMDTKTGQIWVNEPILRNTKNGPDSVVGVHWVQVDSPVSKVATHEP